MYIWHTIFLHHFVQVKSLYRMKMVKQFVLSFTDKCHSTYFALSLVLFTCRQQQCPCDLFNVYMVSFYQSDNAFQYVHRRVKDELYQLFVFTYSFISSFLDVSVFLLNFAFVSLSIYVPVSNLALTIHFQINVSESLILFNLQFSVQCFVVDHCLSFFF